LETEDVIDLLTTYKYSESHNKIPEGTKVMYFLWLKTTGTWTVEIKVNAVVFQTIVEYGTLVKDLHHGLIL